MERRVQARFGRVPVLAATARAAGVPADKIRPPLDPALLAEVLVKDAWVTTSLGGRWKAAFRFAIQRERVVIAELRVMPDDGADFEPGEWSGSLLGLAAKVPPGGLSTAVLKRVRVLANRAAASELLVAARRASESRPEDRPSLSALTQGLAAPRVKGGRSRPKVSDYDLARLALDYVRNLRNQAPLKALQRKHRLTYGQVLGRIHEARRRGLLSPTGRGHGGGALTSRAETILEQGRRTR